ncbi:MAG: NAD(P)-binding protein [Erythrobacter sp.]|nr:NAD(P)-binding protein [Erythrobacter sp.]
MDDQSVGIVQAPTATRIESCDLCVVGAGLAGLNALWVATDYLPEGSKVALIDRHPRCGGMWTETYDFVRLHQPHPYFTVGDIPWDWNKPPEYLATKPEILRHLEYCLSVIRKKFSLVELFGYDADIEANSDINPRQGLRIPCSALDPDRPNLTVEARRVIVARGNEVPIATPLNLTSAAVTSATPVDLQSHLQRDPSAPVFVIGSGKTGMDTAHQIIVSDPERPVSIVGGRGTVFFDRNWVAPAGLERWWKGKLTLKIFGDVAMRFDGTNYDEAFAYCRGKYTIGLDGSGEHCFFGYLSRQECKTVEDGMAGKIDQYLDDVIDTDEGPALVFRSGAMMPVPPGSIIVNCTGFLLRGDSPPIDRVSTGGAMLTISSRGSLHFLSSVSAYFLTHLFFSERRVNAPVYAIDTDALFELDRRAWFMAAITQAFMNPLVLLNALSMRTFDRCGLNTDRLFPLPRIVATLAEVQLNRRHYVEHCRQSLDRIAQTYGVRCGEIDWS